MMQSLSSYWKFLKHPHLLRLSSNKNQLKREFFTLLTIDIVFGSLVVGIHLILSHFKLVREYEYYNIFEHGIWLGLLLGVILVPPIEEVLFRFQLRKRALSLYFVAVSISLIAYTFTKNDYVLFITGISLLMTALMAQIYLAKLTSRRARIAWRRYFAFLFYFTAIVFGLAHLGNAKDLTMADPAFLIFVSSQTLGGLSMGYIRIKYGLTYSILLHSAFNLVVLLAAILFSK